jgi:hypothetical protein
MRRRLLYLLLALAAGGCVLDVTEEIVTINTSASGKDVTEVYIGGSNYRHRMNILGGADTLTASIALVVSCHSKEQAEHTAHNVSAYWTSGGATELRINYGKSDKELMSLDGVTAVIPSKAALWVDGPASSVSVSGMEGDVTVNGRGSLTDGISVDTRGYVDIQYDEGDLTASTGLGGYVNIKSGKIELSVGSSSFESVNVNRSDSCGEKVNIHIQSGAKIHFKLSTGNGTINVQYDGLSYKTGSSHSDGDSYESGSGKNVEVNVTDGDIIISY